MSKKTVTAREARLTGALLEADRALTGEAAASPGRLSDLVQRRRVSELVPYARNARTHPREQVEQIAESIRALGFIAPVLIDPDGGVVAGHGRILAAQMLGLAEVPCLVVEGWSEAQQRAYVLADNKLAEGSGWDRDLCRFELRALDALEFKFELTGFSAADLLAEEQPAEPEKVEAFTVSRSGDVWLLGAHRLVVGDADPQEADAAVKAWERKARDRAMLEDTGEEFGLARARRYGERV
jgi:ParB-like chromosome segregation protein Spo0J